MLEPYRATRAGQRATAAELGRAESRAEDKAKLQAVASGAHSRDREVLDLREVINRKEKEVLDLKDDVDAKERQILDHKDRVRELERRLRDMDEKVLMVQREMVVGERAHRSPTAGQREPGRTRAEHQGCGWTRPRLRYRRPTPRTNS